MGNLSTRLCSVTNKYPLHRWNPKSSKKFLKVDLANIDNSFCPVRRNKNKNKHKSINIKINRVSCVLTHTPPPKKKYSILSKV